MTKELNLDLLSQGFRERQPIDPTTLPGPCSSNDQIWDAANGLLSPKQTRKIVEHTVRCANCATAWRLAKNLGDLEKQNPHRGESQTGKVVPFRAKARMQWVGLASIAAVILLAVGIGLYQAPQPAQPIQRSGQMLSIVSLIEETALPREACELKWQLAEADADVVYQVRVTTEDVFNVLFEADDLTSPSVTIPLESLRGVPEGSFIIWQVTASLPNGTSLSASFVNPIR